MKTKKDEMKENRCGILGLLLNLINCTVLTYSYPDLKISTKTA